MFTYPQTATEDWMKPAKETFDFWISFWPTAPAFGVEWRFASLADKTVSVASHQFESVQKQVSTKTTPKAIRRVTQKAVTATSPAPAALERVSGVMPKVVAEPVEDSENGVPAGLLSKAPATPDDLKLIKGIGPSLEKQLNALGVYNFEQVAGFSDADLDWVDEHLTSVKGRCFRDDWVGQAKALIS